MQKKALKLYNKIPSASNDAVAEHSNPLYPRYGLVRDSSDIHYIGRETKIPNREDSITGFASIGFPKEGTQLEKRKEFEKLLEAVLFDDVEDDDDDINSYRIITEILGDGWIEDDPEYNDIIEKARQCTDEDGYDTEDEDYDMQRDSPAEFRARKLTPQRIIPYVQSNRENRDVDEDDLVEMFNNKVSKKDILKEFRSRGYSPYALNEIAQSLNGRKDDNELAVMIDRALNKDDMRNFLNNIFKHEDEYISDLRMKSLIPCINKRFY
jgi:hypothetical protein